MKLFAGFFVFCITLLLSTPAFAIPTEPADAVQTLAATPYQDVIFGLRSTLGAESQLFKALQNSYSKYPDRLSSPPTFLEIVEDTPMQPSFFQAAKPKNFLCVITLVHALSWGSLNNSTLGSRARTPPMPRTTIEWMRPVTSPRQCGAKLSQLILYPEDLSPLESPTSS